MKRIQMNTIRIFLLWLVFTALICPDIVYPQSSDAIFKDDVSVGLQVVADYFTQPLNWNSTDWWRFGGVAALTFGTMSVDATVRDLGKFKDLKNEPFLYRFGRWAGHGKNIFILSAGLYGAGIFGDNTDVRIAGRDLFAAFVTAGAATTILKTVIGRYRPYREAGPFKFEPPGLDNYRRALPSGHSTLGWLTAGVLAKSVNSPVLKAVFYSGAAIISASRIYHDKHWLSDVILGGIIGYTAADFVVRQGRQLDEKRKTPTQYGLVHPQVFSIQVSF